MSLLNREVSVKMITSIALSFLLMFAANVSSARGGDAGGFQSAKASSHSSNHAHYQNQGGHYIGGHGSSHKGGHYVNPRTGNHYTHHNP
jgi:hypothetical protein